MSSLEYQNFTARVLAVLIPVLTAIVAILPRYRRMTDLQKAFEIGRRVGHYESRKDTGCSPPPQMLGSDPFATGG